MAKEKAKKKTKAKAKPKKEKAKLKKAAAAKPKKAAAKEPTAAKPKTGQSQQPADGKPTSETRILACQCGSTGFDIKKRTKTSIALVCAKCGLRSSVKGNLATIRVRQQEILYALANTVVTPDEEPDDASEGPTPGEKVGDGTGGVGAEYITLRFRIMKGDQKEIIDRAMEAVRVANCADDKFREQTWQGHALEWICADFLSGCSHDVLQIVDAMDAAVGDAIRLAEDDGNKEPTARKIRDLRAKVRDKLAAESGILPEELLDDDLRQLDLPAREGDTPDEDEAYDGSDEAEDEAEKEAEFEPVHDGGRLLTAVQATLDNYYEEAVNAGVDSDGLPEFIVRDGAVPIGDLLARWTKAGGYLIRILGDKRTIDAEGNRMAVCAWVAAEPAELALDFSIEYDDATDDILGDGACEVIELLPPDYDEIDKWAAPHFADGREKL